MFKFGLVATVTYELTEVNKKVVRDQIDRKYLFQKIKQRDFEVPHIYGNLGTSEEYLISALERIKKICSAVKGGNFESKVGL